MWFSGALVLDEISQLTAVREYFQRSRGSRGVPISKFCARGNAEKGMQQDTRASRDLMTSFEIYDIGLRGLGCDYW